MKIYLILSLLVAGLFLAIYHKGKSDCEQKNLLKEKEKEIIVKEIIINENKKLNERRTKALLATPDDNILWLRENICQDCR